MAHPSPTRYSGLSIAMHWLMALLLVAVYACIELKGNFPKGSEPRELLKHWHFMLGLGVFALVWLRLLVRLLHKTPAISPAPPAWQTGVAHLMHLALYVLMIGMPLLGWLLLNAEGKPAPFFGLELPLLVDKDSVLAERLEELHEFGAVAGYWLIGLHAAAGLFHHYFSRDNTLTRMLPGR
ncbi:cytochrome b [Geopseudomonas guangdongensis]|uniref:Cytochrome b561 n=1 Tax=Geopseudomonas guangdongensis TaxID=1245526 RepID=A0A1H2GPD8_9GAMM|nr:cytochrome b [Pseudomonas guangdongensis]SDU21510.1 cytochrome b561 [Pseudomonas guangdongensis]